MSATPRGQGLAPEHDRPAGDSAAKSGGGSAAACRGPGSPALRNGRCPACGHPLEIVVVHGHGQCRVCGTNIEPCCQGGPIPPEGLK